jgi:hypothetical protein
MTTIPEYLKQIDFYASRIFKDPVRAYDWKYRKNDAFDGMSAIGYIEKNGEKGALEVRDYIKAVVYG